jgi:hypothetical protein
MPYESPEFPTMFSIHKKIARNEVDKKGKDV